MEKIIYGVAYYYEYLPYDRLQEDIAMMKKAGINVVRIAESTWSTYEKSPGKFDFSTVDLVIDEMAKAGIEVIIGTPTYAVPSWLVELDSNVMVSRKNSGRAIYGPRQSMDITNATYLRYAERIIRKLIERTARHANVIGFQIDNETKAYGSSSKNVQKEFVEYLKDEFDNDLDKLNAEFGLDYWSNRIDSWENFPDVNGTINGSLGAEFEKFQRLLVDRFLQWQADIVSEYKREDQFVTQNFDFEWRGYSYGVQPEVNHFKAAKATTIASCDIYHPTQAQLTGQEIAFCGDITRNLKKNNYLVMETEAQGFPQWTPYQNQLLLQAYSHVASGANGVMYWHWHSIHNSAESYWRGLLSHDFKENATYTEAIKIGSEFQKLSPKLVNLKKKNNVALVVSNEALTALNWFPIDLNAAFQSSITYNDIVKAFYTQLYQINIEVDIVSPDVDNWTDYEILVVPALYAGADEIFEKLANFVEKGGKLLTGFKTAVANEHVKISSDGTPRNLQETLGMHYNQFAIPQDIYLQSEFFDFTEAIKVIGFMEMLEADQAQVLAQYDNSQFTEKTAITLNHKGQGKAVYLGCLLEDSGMKQLIQSIFTKIFDYQLTELTFPLIQKSGYNDEGKKVNFFFNYAKEMAEVTAPVSGKLLRTDGLIEAGNPITIAPWDVVIIEE
ncbi:beta-galactosidase [Enterococcus sp. HY326]|uniref:beta-galactosidase n=1 Tax=Enterococcus sp. HY326 TaxID=2971265 RepID=UPI00223ECE24|nr:beta-galactosidase [Enterococcus sp. HY326]